MSGRNKKKMYKKINERLESLDHHLVGWQSKFLSKAGKLTLIKAVAQAIPTYTMNAFQLLKGIIWVCRSKWEGGLGFRDLELFNRSLLASTFWKIMNKPHSLLGKVLRVKYFPKVKWLNARVGRKPSSIWRSHVWGKELLEVGTKWRIGNGSQVLLKTDKWLPQPFTFKMCSPNI